MSGFVHVAGNPEPLGAEELWYEGRGGVKLRAMIAPPLKTDAHGPRGSVMVCTGRTEFIEKYFEVVSELQRRGFTVLVLDWRGQGLSGRLTANPLKGHLESFDDAAMDLATALKTFAARLPRPHIALAHSMGGAILMRALQRRMIEIDGAVFSSPLFAIARFSPPLVSLVRFLHAIGAGRMFAPGAPHKWRKENWRRSPVTQDRERHARAQGLVLENPRLALAGPTVGWIAAALDAVEGFAQPRALAHVRAPIAIIAAGRESIVDNDRTEAIARLLPDATFTRIEGAKHEIMMERDEYRAQFWAAFDALAARVAPAA